MSVDTVNPDKLRKLLTLAGHANTNDNEALLALRRASDMLERSGRSLSDLTLSGFSSAASPPNRSMVQWMRQIEELQAEVAVKSDMVRTLSTQVTNLKMSLQAAHRQIEAAQRDPEEPEDVLNWKFKLYKRLDELNAAPEKLTDSELCEILSEEFGRDITLKALRAAKKHLKF